MEHWVALELTAQKSRSRPRKMTLTHDDRYLALTDLTASFIQLATDWRITAGITRPASSIRRRLLHCALCARMFDTRSPNAKPSKSTAYNILKSVANIDFRAD